jgi:hypothetical protein
MNDPSVNLFLAGMVTAGFLASGLYFARFWARSRDSFFLAFTAAFWLLALNQMFVAVVHQPEVNEVWLYLMRVVAFLLIAAAIVRKNAGDTSDD